MKRELGSVLWHSPFLHISRFTFHASRFTLHVSRFTFGFRFDLQSQVWLGSL
ncbi:MAG: hypothetical protein NT167_11295 [Verrucomicrobia bacterium]|nr:hypothetical protein [Verrucomicrobiota bacterium]